MRPRTEPYKQREAHHQPQHIPHTHIPNACSSNTGYLDELAWAALFLHKATGEARYLEAAEAHYPACCSAAKLAAPGKHAKAGKAAAAATTTASAFTWDDKAPGVQLLLHNATGNARYAADATAFLNAWIDRVPRTPGGLAYFAFAPLQYAASAAFLALVAAGQGLNAAANRRFAREQLHYMLGLERSGRPGEASPKRAKELVRTQPVALAPEEAAKVWSNITSPTVSPNAKQSFLVGFGPRSPQSPHHRASSCEYQRGNATCSCSDKPNFFVLFGALVGGPLPDDSYGDDCQDFEANYVSLVGNAGFTSAVAGLKQLAMLGSNSNP